MLPSVLRLDERPAARPPAVLLGGLNLVRALGLGGIPSIIAWPERSTLAMASRYCVGRWILPPLFQRAAVLERLLVLGRMLSERFGKRVPLFYGDDDQLELVHELREPLARHFALVLNDADVADALNHKARFQTFAQARGLPVPRRLAFEELPSIAFPVLAKPSAKTQWKQSRVRRELLSDDGKARIYADGPALLRDARATALARELIFQEYVPGGDDALWSFHGFADERSELLACFTGRKIRTCPPLTGESAYVELVHDEALESWGRALVARAGLKGPLKLDVKRHAVTGRFYLLEVNARFNLWHYLGAAAGVNVPRIAYDYLLEGRRPAAARPRNGYRWLSLALDFRAYRELHSRGELGTGPWLASLAAGPKVCDFFSWRDPAPFVLACLRRAGHLPRRLQRWLSTAS